MALSRKEQARIMREDRARRYLREQDEMVALAASKSAPLAKGHLYANPELIRGIGVISPPRHVSANPTAFEYGSWARGMRGRTIGVAHGQPWDTTDSAPSMKVTHPEYVTDVRGRRIEVGTIETDVPVSSTRTTKRRSTRTPQVAPHRTTSADLTPIQNANDDS